MYNVFWAKVHICRVRSDLLERHGVLIASTILPVTPCFVYKVIRDLESIYHLCINPIRRIGLIHK